MTTVTSRTAPATVRIGAVLAALLAAVDILGTIVFGLGTAPVEVILITMLLAIATFVGAAVAWRGSRWGVWLAVITRAIASLSVIPIIVVPDAPKDAIPMTIVTLVLTVVAIALLLAGSRTRRG
ncbi:hypothetical protein [uncultured Microbacterium sp.]|uniref:hypothetical protein n=1 Tax=uncultured Microbacterium sp. TaxID=191216 RepID=UPI0025D44D71|nr:hypothetical protein [uncultured Microbacterium sp.]